VSERSKQSADERATDKERKGAAPSLNDANGTGFGRDIIGKGRLKGGDQGGVRWNGTSSMTLSAARQNIRVIAVN
jgi:hypothetical protein